MLGHPLRWPVDWFPPTTHLAQMHVQAMTWLDQVPDDALFDTLRHWMEHCPPGASRGWRAAWNSYTVSLRILAWIDTFSARADRLAVPDDVLRSLANQVRFLSTHLEWDIEGNHLVKNAVALLVASASFDGPEAAAWQTQGGRLVHHILRTQVLPDGMHFELSPAYHLQVVADLQRCRDALGPDAALDAALAAMKTTLADLVHPDGSVSRLSDGWPSMCVAPAALLADTPPPGPLVALASAGLYGRREPGALVLVDVGPIAAPSLPAHGHADAFTFEWSVDGHPIVVDPGVYAYEAGPRRLAGRGTAAHNTVVVDGADQADVYGSFRVGRRAKVSLHAAVPDGDALALDASHDGFVHLRGAPIHRRRWRLTAVSIEVDDEVRGGAGQPVVANILLHPAVRATPTADGLELAVGSTRLALRTALPVAIQPAVWWPDYGVEQPTTRLVLDLGPAPARGTWSLQRISSSGRRRPR